MLKNLFQKTVYEVYKSKENLGYQIIETPNMFVILWNNQIIPCLNVAHCEKFTKDEFDFLNSKFKDIKICVASNLPSEMNSPKLKFDEVAHAMLFENSNLIERDKAFEIKLVNCMQDLEMFCKIAGDVFHMQNYITALQKSLAPDLKLNNCNKYISYKNDVPVGIVEICKGSEAALISWVGVRKEFRRQGICRAMLAHAINDEVTKGCYKFVLVATEMGQEVYSKFGFKSIASRYDYIFENK